MTGFRSASIVKEIGCRFLIILCALGFLAWLGSNTGGMQIVCELNARGAATLLQWTGLEAVRSGNLIAINNCNLRVDSECSAVFTVGALVILMSIVPVSFLRISSGILLGTLMIALGNVLRIAFLGHLAISFPAAFEAWHLSLLPVLQLFLTFGIWWIWFDRSIRDNPRFGHHAGEFSIFRPTSRQG